MEKIINRDIYLSRLIDKKENGLIKVITGIRRCGKSYLLFYLFRDYLISSGVKEEQIISIALDDDICEQYRNPDELSKYIRSKIVNKEMYYILIDEVQYAITKKELENVKYNLVNCSPMKRPKQTAEIINEGRDIPIITDERIRERKLGDYEGRDVTEEMENNIWDYKLNYNIPNGENLHDFEKRINEFFDDIKEKYHDKTILIVAHGGIAKVIKSHLYGMPESQNLAEISMNNCEIIEFEI